jgi:capsular exopolysaccharide synthesis family protein
MVGALLIIFSFTAVYTATADVKIGMQQEDARTALVQTDNGVEELPDLSTVESEVQVLRSRNLAQQVIDRFDLTNDPEFNPSLRPVSGIDAWLRDAVEAAKNLAAGIAGSDKPGAPATGTGQNLRDRVTEAFLGRLDVAPIGKSRVLQVKFTSVDASKAAAIVNALVEFYVQDDLERRTAGRERATAWLNERVGELREEVAKAEQAVQDFQTSSGMIETRDVDLTVQDVSELSSQLINVEAQRTEAEARLQRLEEAIRSQSGAESVAEVLGSSLVQNLRQQEAEVRREMAQLSQQYGDKHPAMLAVTAQLKDLQLKIDTEIDRIGSAIRGEVSVARAREQAIKRRLDELKSQVAEMNDARVTSDALEREATASRTLLEHFLLRAQELQSLAAVREANAEVISPAGVPPRPSFPNRTILGILAACASLGCGVLMGLAVEALESGFRSVEQIEDASGVPALGIVPALKGVRSFGAAPEEYVLKKPNSAFSEAVRSIYTGLLMDGLDRPPRRILITSSLAGEGKTVTVVSLARMLASGGERVVVVDCDLRRPRVHKIFGVPSERGVLDVLQGTATPEEVIVRDSMSSADLLPAGHPSGNPTGLLAGSRMKELLETLSSRYEWVLIDSAPVLALSDTRLLAHQVDRVVFLVRWGRTRRATALAGLRQTLDAGGRIAGVVLSNVDIRKNSRYGYGDSGLYARELRRYYVG